MADTVIPVKPVNPSVKLLKEYGRWTVLGDAEPLYDNRGRVVSRSLCECQCGTVRPVINHCLKKLKSLSCGCAKSELASKRQITHGHSCHGIGMRTSEYNTWAKMLSRCNSPVATSYQHYGGRGISVCDRWAQSFESFLEDMGRKPSLKHSIDRIDNDGNYEPGNCRWATRPEQCNNMRTTVFLTEYGKTLPREQWAKIAGISGYVIKHRMARGWTQTAAIWTPVQKRKPKVVMSNG